MAGLFHSLNIGSESLYANRQGIDTTAHNISNAQTEGYSRQRVRLSQRDPMEKAGLLIGNGVYVGSIERFHNKFIERQVNLAHNDVGDSEARMDSLTRLGEIFSPELNSSLADQLNNFFSSWQNLSKYPEELTVRTQVKEQGENIADSFRRIDSELRRQRQGINEYIKMTAEEASETVSTIANLNDQIRQTEVGVRNPSNDLRDQRDRLVRKLSNIIDMNYYEDADGMVTIHGPGGVQLIDRGRAASIKVRQNGNNQGLFDLIVVDSEDSSERNITESVNGGRLKGLINIRDVVSSSLLESNNEMATKFVDLVNGNHRRGFGLEQFRNTNGRNFFESISDPKFAAQNIKLSLHVLNSTDAISASSLQNSPGDNVVANNIARIQSSKVFTDTDATLNEYYADYVGVLGMETVRVKQVNESDQIIMADLQSRREAVSGVSLDEEATNLIRWQTAFTASSKVVTTVDEMLQTVLNLKR
ncbi:MAG: flagellar hook-associated protein FlgK [Oligoflexales bacterium]